MMLKPDMPGLVREAPYRELSDEILRGHWVWCCLVGHLQVHQVIEQFVRGYLDSSVSSWRCFCDSSARLGCVEVTPYPIP